MNQIPSSKNKANGAIYVLMALFGIVLVATIVLFTRLTTASALQSDQANVENTYPAMVGSRIDTCSLCHLGSPPALNSYGSDYLSHGRNAAAAAAIAGLDSDGDGFTNLQEIQALTFPGNASDFPAAATATSTNESSSNAYPPPTTATATSTTAAYPPPATSVPTQASTATFTQTAVPPTATWTRTALPTQAPTNTSVPTQRPTATSGSTKAPTSTPVPTQESSSTVAPTQESTSTSVPTQASSKTVDPIQKPTRTTVATLQPTKGRSHATRTPTAVSTHRPTRTPRATRAPSRTPDCRSKGEDDFHGGCRRPHPTRTLGPTPTGGFCDFTVERDCSEFNQLLGGFNGVSFGNFDLFFVPLKQMAGTYAGGRAGK